MKREQRHYFGGFEAELGNSGRADALKNSEHARGTLVAMLGNFLAKLLALLLGGQGIKSPLHGAQFGLIVSRHLEQLTAERGVLHTSSIKDVRSCHNNGGMFADFAVYSAQMNVRIIGVAGTNGAGKDAVGNFLAQKHNYLFVSVSDLIRAELRARGLGVERENTRMLSAEWRREFGLSVLVDRAMAEFAKVQDRYAGVVMASLRNPAEPERIHELGGVMVWVDADPKVRYARVTKNARPGRDADDNKTFEQFLAEEKIEMQGSGDAAALNMNAVRDQADIVLMNDGADLAEFERQVETALGL